MIYLDHASTTRIYPNVIKEMESIMLNHYGNPSNAYHFGAEANALVESARKNIADSIGASPEEIYFTSGSSESNAWVTKQKEYFFISPYEHHSLTGAPNTIKIDETYLDRAIASYDEFKPLLTNERAFGKTYGFSWMYVNNETGEIFPIKEYIEKAKYLGVITHTDATQAIGSIKVDVNELGVDMLSASAHKFHGPKGIGFLYVNKNIINLKPLIYGTQENNLRGGTLDAAYIYGMGMAIKEATSSSSLQQKASQGKRLKETVIDKLKSSGIDYIINSPENSVNNIINFSLKGVESEVISDILGSDYGIYVGTGSACTTGSLEPSAVLEAKNVPAEYIRGPFRLSFDISNTKLEVERAMDAIIKVYKELFAQ